MNKQRNYDNLQQIYRYTPLLVLIVIAISYSFTAQLGNIDDKMFVELFKESNESLIGFIRMRYNTWSSRIFIESILVFMVNNHLIWRIVNAITLVGTGIVISKLLPRSSEVSNLLIVLFIALYPYIDMSSAGWIATTLNYSWPLFFGLIALLPIKMFYNSEKFSIIKTFFFLFFTVLATNVEQVAGILFFVYSFILIKSIFENKKPFIVYVQFIITIFSLLLIFVSPGNSARKIIEIGVWFPNYVDLSLVRLFEIGFSSTLYPLIFKQNSIFIFYLTLIIILALSKSKMIDRKLLSITPIVAILAFNVFDEPLNRYFPIINHIKLALTQTGTGASLNSLFSLVPDLIILSILTLIIISIVQNIKIREKIITNLGILVIGFLSRFVMIFSPTIWASADRTFIFFYFSIILHSLLLIDEIEENGDASIINSVTFKYVVWSLIIISFLSNLYLVRFRFA